jgi:hypothetical protein
MTNKELSDEIMELKLALQRVTILLESLQTEVKENVAPSIKDWNKFSSNWKNGVATFLIIAGMFWFVVQEAIKLGLKKAGF